MRNITKLAEPDVLAANGVSWLQEYLADPNNPTKRYRYRHADIKATLRTETSDKCVYCESKLGHSSHGDIEHKVPSSKVPTRHFDWLNLTLACQECNRRKNDFYEEQDGFLDPYADDVETMLEHHGPIVMWKTGEARAEVSVGVLELSSVRRLKLFEMKVQKLVDISNLLERYESAPEPSAIRGLLKLQIREMASPHSEYSAMVREAVIKKGYGNLL
jgi:uncharacterized protein (TIGR02646 family)